MIDNAPINGTIIIPSGKYYIGNSGQSYAKYLGVGTVNANCDYGLIINKAITIQASGVTFIYDTSSTPYTAVLVNKTQNVTIQGLTITGSIKTTSYTMFRAGLEVFFSKSVTLSNVSINQEGQAILINRSTYCVVNCCSTSETSASGIEIFASSYNTVKDCSVVNANDGDISLYGWIGGSNNIVMNNTVSETSGVSGMQGITSEIETGDTISGNTVTGMYYGIDIKNGTKNATITGNVATGNRINIDVRSGDANSSQAASSGITIKDNNASLPNVINGVGGFIMVESKLLSNNIVIKNNLVGYTSADLKYVDGIF